MAAVLACVWIAAFVLHVQIPVLAACSLEAQALLKCTPIVLLAKHTLTNDSRLLAVGLLLSAVGDIVLELEGRSGSELEFIIGLVAFLCAHIAYVVAFSKHNNPHQPQVAVGVIAGAAFLLARLLPHVSASGQGEMVLPVCVYCTALAIMAYSAIKSGSTLAAFGSLVFVSSDFTLAWNKFCPAPVTWWWQPKLIVMGTYYAAQLLIAASAGATGKSKHD